MKTVIKLEAELTDELYLKQTGHTTFVQVEPGGTLNGLGYGASGFDVVVLDDDGDAIAYRYTDDSIDTEWKIGDIGDVADAVCTMQVELIKDALTDEMIDIWHSGVVNGEFNDLIRRFGVFEIYGSRAGNEPLTISAGE